MKLTICSEGQAIKKARQLSCKTSIISITCIGEKDVVFFEHENLISIFCMKFNDIDSEKITAITPPKQEDFNGLKWFVDHLECEELIVHCGAGESRSAAVAAAINEYLDLGYKIFGANQYEPNKLVYKYACAELHRDPIGIYGADKYE